MHILRFQYLPLIWPNGTGISISSNDGPILDFAIVNLPIQHNYFEYWNDNYDTNRLILN